MDEQTINTLAQRLSVVLQKKQTARLGSKESHEADVELASIAIESIAGVGIIMVRAVKAFEDIARSLENGGKGPLLDLKRERLDT